MEYRKTDTSIITGVDSLVQHNGGKYVWSGHYTCNSNPLHLAKCLSKILISCDNIYGWTKSHL